MTRLFVFDMDGTLLPNTTALLEIAKLTGHFEEITHIEKLYVEGKVDNFSFSRTVVEFWKSLSLNTVKEAFEKAPKIDNIKKVLQTIDENGDVSCLITASQDFFAHHFYDYGFDFIFASKDFCLDKRELIEGRSLQAQHKLMISQQLCHQLGFPFHETVAFGDSISDVKLFQNLVHTVSVNGDHHVRSLASHHYQGKDLLEAFSGLAAKVPAISL